VAVGIRGIRRRVADETASMALGGRTMSKFKKVTHAFAAALAAAAAFVATPAGKTLLEQYPVLSAAAAGILALAALYHNPVAH
jgi:hypothetical protein